MVKRKRESGGEVGWIERIRRRAVPPPKSGVFLGIGDDCAIFRARGAADDLLFTTDMLIEDVHFRRATHSAGDVGWKALARGLSDIAAMAGQPVAAFLSLALPRDLPQNWLRRFTRGLLKLAERYGVILAGGDTAESPHGILADIVVVGSVPKGKVILRSGARPGDRIYVSGELGGSAAAVGMFNKKRVKPNARSHPRHFFPEPRIALGRYLRENRLLSAMIDTSDGLSTDLAHLCEESGVGAELLAEAVPRAIVGKPPREVDLELALDGGEDYELLFTVPARKPIPSRIANVPITQIGYITRGRKIFLTNREGLKRELAPQGWEHFRK